MSRSVSERASKPVRVVRLVAATEATSPAGAATQTGAAVQPKTAPKWSRPPIVVTYPRPLPRWVGWSVWWAAGLAVACAWDRAVWLGVSSAGKPKLEWLEQMAPVKAYWELFKGLGSMHGAACKDWLIATAYQIVYRSGQIYPWLGAAIVIIFHGWMGTDVARLRQGLRRGLFVVAIPALAGIAAELLKTVARRARPEFNDGAYAWLPYPADASKITSNVGLASSHAAVAIGAALAVGVIYPRARLVLWPLAALCVLSRVLVGAHFVSDAYVGVTLAALVYAGLKALDLRINRGIPITRPVGA